MDLAKLGLLPHSISQLNTLSWRETKASQCAELAEHILRAAHTADGTKHRDTISKRTHFTGSKSV